MTWRPLHPSVEAQVKAEDQQPDVEHAPSQEFATYQTSLSRILVFLLTSATAEASFSESLVTKEKEKD